MEYIIITTAILQSFAISLGVGSSTLAIVNFFVAIADGKIDDTERRMMGVVYVVLRIAMVAILVTTLLLAGVAYAEGAVTTTTVLQVLFILVLFINAILMTAHLMPSTFGPSIQAGTWYSFGFLAALSGLGLAGFSLPASVLAYISFVVLVTALVNGVMAWLRAHQRGVLK